MIAAERGSVASTPNRAADSSGGNCPIVDIAFILALIDFHNQLDGWATIASVVIALAVVWVVDGLKKPRVKHLGWHTAGDFEYFDFIIRGRIAPNWVSDPGAGRIRLTWRGHGSFAKWDELAEPGLYDQNGGFTFQVSMVPQTFYLPLTIGEKYISADSPPEGRRATRVFRVGVRMEPNRQAVRQRSQRKRRRRNRNRVSSRRRSEVAAARSCFDGPPRRGGGSVAVAFARAEGLPLAIRPENSPGYIRGTKRSRASSPETEKPRASGASHI